MPTIVAIANYWTLQEKNSGAFDAIHRAMVGDAYSRKDTSEALEQQGPEPDMSDYTYLPVIGEQTASYIEELFNTKLPRATVKRRPEVGPNAFEITHVPHIKEGD